MTAFRDAMQYDHILPRRASAENLWPGLSDGGVRPLEPWLDAYGLRPVLGAFASLREPLAGSAP